jgi:peptidoglycan/xylan/chitin deacetylase (PgdA/CDA1 family)
MSRTLVLTYHALEAGPAPLFCDPVLFAQHVDVTRDAGAALLTVSELAAALRGGTLPECAVALTFDDGYASIRAAADHGVVGTVFAIARRLGGSNDWPSQPAHVPRRPLADAAQLRELASAGWEIGSHGLDHVGVASVSALGESRTVLEGAVGVSVRSFAYPYGVVPRGTAPQRAGYDAAVTTRLAPVTASADAYALPRVDAHYLRRPALLRAALGGKLDLYFRVRGVGANIRRLMRKDYVAV